MNKMLKKIHAWAGGLRSKKLLVPYLLSFAALVVAAVLLLSLWFSQSVRTELYNSIYEGASEETGRMAESLENTVSDLNSLSVKLNKLGEITPASFSRDINGAYRILTYFNYASLKYDDMVMLYPGEDLLMSVGGTAYPTLYFAGVPEYEAMLEDITDCRELSFISTMSYGTARSRAQLICVQPLGLSSGNPKYFVLYVIKYGTLKDQLLGVGANDTDTLCRLSDADGNVLWCNSDLLLDSPEAMAGESATVPLGDKRYIHTRSAVAGKMDMVVLHVVASQFESITRTGRGLVWLCAALVLLATCFAFVSIVKGYRPIDHIVASYRATFPDGEREARSDLETLSMLANSHSMLLRERAMARDDFPDEWLQELFVMNIVQGRFTDDAALDNFRRNLKIDFTGGESFVCLLLVDETPGPAKERELRALLDNSNEEFHGCICVLPAQNRILCLVNAASADAVTRADVSWRLMEALDMRATCGTGTACADMHDIGRSYIEAHAALDYRLIRGRNTVILFDELPEESQSKSDYPAELLKDYIISLKTWDAEAIGAQMSSILEYMHETRPGLQQTRCLCYELTSAFFAEVRARYGSAALHAEGLDVFSISEYDSASELMDKIRRLCDQVQRYMDRPEEGQDGMFLNSCLEIMRENIPNPQFSMEDIAGAFGITPQTLRRRFKQLTGSTLIGTMTELRIRRAEELLATTDLDVGTILLQVGYTDASSFTRRFRSATGVSPSQYRRANRADAPEEEAP